LNSALTKPPGVSRLAGASWIHRESGFTLVEILVVIAIIGILAVIAITQLNGYKDKAYCSEIKADLANLAAHQESYFTDNHIYLAVTRNPDGTSNIPNFRWTGGVTVVSSTGGVSSWTAVGRHVNCSTTVAWDSSAGGLQ
jgi:prepilin-type N-terminal cleavage/methylation domain-containing protein